MTNKTTGRLPAHLFSIFIDFYTITHYHATDALVSVISVVMTIYYRLEINSQNVMCGANAEHDFDEAVSRCECVASYTATLDNMMFTSGNSLWLQAEHR